MGNGPLDVWQHNNGFLHQTGWRDQIIQTDSSHQSVYPKFATRKALPFFQYTSCAVATYRLTVYHGRDRHSRRSGRSIAVYWIQYSDDGDSHGSICSWLTPPGSANSLGHPIQIHRWRSPKPCQSLGVGWEWCKPSHLSRWSQQLAKRRESQAITKILLAPYLMDTSWMPELFQLARDTPIPVVDERTPFTQLVHQTDGGDKTRTYHYSNLHAWKLWRRYSDSRDTQNVLQS